MADKTPENERIYTIPLREVQASPRNHRSDRAIRHIKSYLARHMKSQDIWIDASVNEAIWAQGMYEIPRRIRVRARRFDDGVVEVSLPEAEHTTSIREEIKKRKEKAGEKKEKAAEKKKEEKGEEKPPEKKEDGTPTVTPAEPASKEAVAPPATDVKPKPSVPPAAEAPKGKPPVAPTPRKEGAKDTTA